MTTSGRLCEIAITGLFGARSSEPLRIKLDPRRPTVLTGGNGTGKSTILRLVGAISALDIATLREAPIQSIALSFESIPTLRYSRSERGGTVTWGDKRHHIRLLEGIESLPMWALDALSGDTPAGDFTRRLRQYAQEQGVDPHEYRLVRDALVGHPRTMDAPSPPWFSDFKEAFAVLHVTDQRLVVDADADARRYTSDRARSSRRAVVAASRDLASKMLEIDSAYARASQARDRAFPREVIAAMAEHSNVTDTRLEELLQSVNSRRERLRQVGLLDSDQTFEQLDFGLDRPEVRPVIATFLESTLSKLTVLDELSHRLQTFKAFLDARFRTKRVELRRREGVRFIVDDSIEITPEQLSSGEQQLFVLAYEVLFRAEMSTLLIVDEPEISLHVLWQDTLIDDLVELGEPSRVQFLMATHSPALLASHPDLERSLDTKG